MAVVLADSRVANKPKCVHSSQPPDGRAGESRSDRNNLCASYLHFYRPSETGQGRAADLASRSIHVKNLPVGVQEALLQQVFEKHGRIEAVNVNSGSNTAVVVFGDVAVRSPDCSLDWLAMRLTPHTFNRIRTRPSSHCESSPSSTMVSLSKSRTNHSPPPRRLVAPGERSLGSLVACEAAAHSGAPGRLAELVGREAAGSVSEHRDLHRRPRLPLPATAGTTTSHRLPNLAHAAKQISRRYCWASSEPWATKRACR